MTERRWRWPSVLAAFLLLSGCAPSAAGSGETQLELLLSAASWGGLPFGEGDKRRAFARALARDERVRLELPVRFELLSGDAELLSATARYEVDGRRQPPRLSAVYALKLRGAEGAELLLHNTLTGVQGRVRLGARR